MDREAERALCHRYEGRIRGYGLRHLRDAAAADDLVQHVLLTLLTAVREGRAGAVERLDGWVLVTCRNVVMDMRRGDWRRQRLAARTAAEAIEVDESGFAAGPAWAETIDQARLAQCLRGLEARARMVVVATFVEDRTAEEIGRVVGLSAGNVRVIRHRALARLQACIEGRAS